MDAAWLGQWADGAEAPPPIDNAPLLCEHGKLDPGKAAGEFAPMILSLER